MEKAKRIKVFDSPSRSRSRSRHKKRKTRKRSLTSSSSEKQQKMSKDRSKSKEKQTQSNPVKKKIKKYKQLKKIKDTTMPLMIEIIVNDRMGRKVRIKCFETDTIGDLKKLVGAHIGTRAEKLRLQRSYQVFKDHISIGDYEIHHGMSIDLYYN